MPTSRTPSEAGAGTPGVQGIDDVVVSGTTAPPDWEERIFAGRAADRVPARPARHGGREPKPADPALARAMRAMRR